MTGDSNVGSLTQGPVRAYLELLRLELRPGERLLESDLEQRTRLGRTPIREALQEFVRAVAVHGSVPVHGKSCRIRQENVRGRNTSGFLKRWCAATETQRRPLSGLTSARPASGSSACLS